MLWHFFNFCAMHAERKQKVLLRPETANNFDKCYWPDHTERLCGDEEGWSEADYQKGKVGTAIDCWCCAAAVEYPGGCLWAPMQGKCQSWAVLLTKSCWQSWCHCHAPCPARGLCLWCQSPPCLDHPELYLQVTWRSVKEWLLAEKCASPKRLFLVQHQAKSTLMFNLSGPCLSCLQPAFSYTSADSQKAARDVDNVKISFFMPI